MRILLALMLALAVAEAAAESVPLFYEHGTFLVPVVINDRITLNFLLDTGASDVSIPADVFSTLVRTGTILRSDFIDTQEYELADGTTRNSKRFRIRSLSVGNVELRNVIASVSPAEGSLLLGQSFLSRMKTWSIDNERRLLIFNELPGQSASRPFVSSPHSAAAAGFEPPVGDTDVPLTAEEIRRHCANVQFLDADPWPYKKRRVADYYPDQSKRAEEEGRVLVKFRLDSDGHPTSGTVEINSSSGFPRLDQAAIKMIAEESFFPKCSGGKPVVTTPILPVEFSLTNK
jgi:clan AA aspartic protease (TIGR02281 family)